MKNLSLVILILFVISSKNIESQNKDSILVVLKSLNKKAFFLKNNPDSLNFYTDKILKISEEYNIPLYKVKVYGLLGLVNKNNNQFEKSMYFLHKAKNLSKKLNLENEYYRNLNDIAAIHNRTSYYDSAVYYYKRLDKYYKNNKDIEERNRLPLNKMHMANAYLSLDKIDSAIINYNLSNLGLRLIKEKPSLIPHNRLITSNLLGISRAYSLKNNFKTSIIYADSALVLAKENKLYYLLPSLYDKQRQNYDKLGNSSESNKYSELQSLSDTVKINSNQRLVRVSRNPKSLAQNDNDRKERIRKTEKQKILYKSSFFLITVIALILAIITFYFLRSKTKLKAEIVTIQTEFDKFKEKEDYGVEKIITLKSKAIINSKDILYVKSDGHYVEYYLENQNNPEIDRNSLNKVAEILPSNSFIRIHKSFIVNIHRIKIINATKVMLDNGVWINLSRTYKQQLKDILHKED